MFKKCSLLLVGLLLVGCTGVFFRERISILSRGSQFYSTLPLIDSKFKERINTLGFEIGQGVYGRLNWKKLRKFNVVILTPFPQLRISSYETFLRPSLFWIDF